MIQPDVPFLDRPDCYEYCDRQSRSSAPSSPGQHLSHPESDGTSKRVDTICNCEPQTRPDKWKMDHGGKAIRLYQLVLGRLDRVPHNQKRPRTSNYF